MGLPVEINNLMLGSLGGYTVGRSLRFRSSASAYLNRTPAATGNRQKFTWSGWVKRGTLATGTYYQLFGAGGAGSNEGLFFDTSAGGLYLTVDGATTAIVTTAVFRDPSAWYHIVASVDTTQATAANRMIIYINGVQQTSYSGSYCAQNTNFTYINVGSTQHRIGAHTNSGFYFDGYLAEVNFIDGQALTPSSFGAYDTNGVWQPKKYSGTYGTNGFYLPFSNTTSTTTLVQDSSGNGNNWTANNISLTAGTTYDSMIDSPTNAAGTSTGIGNYATFNPLVKFSPNNSSYSSGNLGVQQTGGASGSHACAMATIAMSSGKWYAEFSDDTATYDGNRFGILNINNLANYTNSNPYIGWASDGYVIYKTSTNAVKENNGSSSNIGSNWTAGAIISVAVDIDNSKIWWRVNGGAWFGGGDPAAGTSPVFTIASGNTYAFAVSPYNNNGVTANFGQRPFSYTPPTGFKALNTYNLPAPSISNGAQYMAATTYTGNGTAGRVITVPNINEVGFAWVKLRSGIDDHRLANIVTGGNKHLKSNTTDAESTGTNVIQAFSSNTFTVGNDTSVNANGSTYVGWTWAANGTGVTNNSGTITSTVSANPTAGFSIVTYTGTGANATVGHGLGVAPSMIILRARSIVENWPTWHTGLTSAAYVLTLNTTNAQASVPSVFNSTAPTSSVFSVGTSSGANQSSATYVAYCFSAVSGYSAFGKYTGNGSADGPFIYTGFRPRFIMIKNSTAINNWGIIDTSRDTYNGAFTRLHPNLSQADNTGAGVVIDVLSNGFKCRNSDALENQSGQTMIYAAFAENPFSIARAR